MRKVRDLLTVDYGAYTQKYSGTPGSGPSGLAVPVPEEWITTYLKTLQSSVCLKTFSEVAMSGREVFESSTRRKPLFNECFHAYQRSVNYMLSYWWEEYGYVRPNWNRNWRFKTPFSTYSLAPEPDFSLITTNMQAEAYHTMIPRFEGDISMANFIFEMKDFRDLSNILSKKTWDWLREGGIRKSLSSVATKRLSELHLIDSFVITPLTTDLASLVMQAQRLVIDVQEEFAKKGEQPNIRHFSKQIDQLQSYTEHNVTGNNPEYMKLWKGSKRSSTFTATMEGDYGYRSRGNLEAFMKYWGLHLTAEAVWNAIPLSFLIDYIFSIGHSLNVMRHDNNVKYNVRQYSESILNTLDTGVYAGTGTRSVSQRYFAIDTRVHNMGNDQSLKYFVSGIRSTRYQRRVTTPYWGPFLPRWTVPSSREGFNAAAVLRCLL